MRVSDARQTFLGLWLRLVVEGKELRVFGDGRQVRDFNYVDDVVDALLRVGADDQANGQVYNLGGDEPINLLHLAQLLVRLAGKGSHRLVPWPENRKRIDIGDYYGDYRKIRSKLGWCPLVSLEEGLKRTLQYYEEHHSHYWEAEFAA
jgi:nucleoside-diphosphate-sugar epimerase